MTKKRTISTLENSSKEYHKLSIQVSLNGLSFCVLDTIGNKIVVSENLDFGNELSPFDLQKKTKELFAAHQITDFSFSEVTVIHKNNLFGLVPKALFDEKELANYLKFNTKILANDHLEFDEIESYDMVNVYVPFVNLNNYIYDLFGEFEFMHNATILIQTLLNTHTNGNEPVCYVHVSPKQMEITVLSHKKLLFYNSFQYTSKEDFIYYLLFSLEQLKLDTETTKLRLFGAVEEDDEIYSICFQYIQHISIFVTSSGHDHLEDVAKDSIDFTILNSL